jgi:hypothetical protein
MAVSASVPADDKRSDPRESPQNPSEQNVFSGLALVDRGE